MPSIFVAEASARELAHLELALRRANVVCDLLVPKDTKQALLFINSLTPSSLPYPTLALISCNCLAGRGINSAFAIRRNPAWQKIPALPISSSNMAAIAAAVREKLIEIQPTRNTPVSP